jgi:hypothetical protein
MTRGAFVAPFVHRHMTRHQPARRRREITKVPYLDRKTRNAIVHDWLTFNLHIDHATGRKSSADIAPYSEWNPEAVNKLIREFDPEAPLASTERRRRKSRGRTSAVTAAATVGQPVSVQGVTFVPDSLDDLI